MFHWLNALKAGEQLLDPATWKNRQVTANAILVLLLALVNVLKIKGIEVPVSEEMFGAMSEGIAALIGVLNMYFTTATSKKIGL